MKQLRNFLITVVMLGLMSGGLFSLPSQKESKEKEENYQMELKIAALNALLMMKSEKAIPILDITCNAFGE